LVKFAVAITVLPVLSATASAIASTIGVSFPFLPILFHHLIKISLQESFLGYIEVSKCGDLVAEWVQGSSGSQSDVAGSHSLKIKQKLEYFRVMYTY
jgi:hypothetical protein